MTIAEKLKMTADQFLQLGEGPPGSRLELVNGEIRMSPSPTTVHAFCLSQLFGILRAHIVANRLGVIMSDMDHKLTQLDVRWPDLYFFSTARMHLLDEDVVRHWPDLAIEIISDGSEHTDRAEKYEAYQTFGIPHYWLIDPHKRTAEVFTLKRKKYMLTASGKKDQQIAFAPFPELSIRLPELWWPPR